VNCLDAENRPSSVKIALGLFFSPKTIPIANVVVFFFFFYIDNRQCCYVATKLLQGMLFSYQLNLKNYNILYFVLFSMIYI
jgi:hypothetical protein